MLILTAKKRVSKVKLGDDTAKTPDVDFAIIGESKDNLWSPIVSALNVGVYCLSLEATWAEINNLYSWFVHFFEQNILWF